MSVPEGISVCHGDAGNAGSSSHQEILENQTPLEVLEIPASLGTESQESLASQREPHRVSFKGHPRPPQKASIEP